MKVMLDFFCRCGHQENDVLIENDAEYTCKMCNEKMERVWNKTTYNFRPQSKTEVPKRLLGGGERANFGRFH